MTRQLRPKPPHVGGWIVEGDHHHKYRTQQQQLLLRRRIDEVDYWKQRAGWYDDDISMKEFNSGVYDTYYSANDDNGRHHGGGSRKVSDKTIKLGLKIAAAVAAVVVAVIVYRILSRRSSKKKVGTSSGRKTTSSSGDSKSRSRSHSRTSRSRSRTRRGTSGTTSGSNYELMDDKSDARSKRSSRSRSRSHKERSKSSSRKSSRSSSRPSSEKEAREVLVWDGNKIEGRRERTTVVFAIRERLCTDVQVSCPSPSFFCLLLRLIRISEAFCDTQFKHYLCWMIVVCTRTYLLVTLFSIHVLFLFDQQKSTIKK